MLKCDEIPVVIDLETGIVFLDNSYKVDGETKQFSRVFPPLNGEKGIFKDSVDCSRHCKIGGDKSCRHVFLKRVKEIYADRRYRIVNVLGVSYDEAKGERYEVFYECIRND